MEPEVDKARVLKDWREEWPDDRKMCCCGFCGIEKYFDEDIIELDLDLAPLFEIKETMIDEGEEVKTRIWNYILF